MSTRLRWRSIIRNPEADRLAAEVAALCGETKTVALIQALQERLLRLRRHQSEKALELSRQLDAIAIETAQLPKLDARSAEEILGYDKRGLPC